MIDDDFQQLVERYESVSPDGLRVAVHYEGDDHELVYVHEEVRETYSPEEFEEKVKQLVVEGLSDPPNQEHFRLFGEMNAVVRQFDEALMLHFPIDEFTGIAVTFDVDSAPSLDTLAEIGTRFLAEHVDDQ